MQPKVLILRAPGTNCDVETAHAFDLAGARTEVVHVRRAVESPRLLADSQILCIPGGFSYGDDIASGRIFGGQLEHHLADAMHEFKAAGKLVLGICNGFQVLLKCSLLAESNSQNGPAATLTWNHSGRFEDRWVRLAVDRRPHRAGADATKLANCVFLAGIDSMYLPVAHGEGRFVVRDEATRRAMSERGQLSLRYAPLDAAPASRSLDEMLPFPDNPNGAEANVAGMCDPTGRIFGLMPHPERHVDPTQHPRWTRGEAGEVGDGLQLFKNAVAYFT